MKMSYTNLLSQTRGAGIYALIAFLSLLILFWGLEIWQTDIGIPFIYTGDAVFNLMSIKSLVDNGWYIHNKYLGAPFGLESYDFPFDENLSLAILKLIATFSNPFIAHNLFYILTFPLTAVTSLFALKQLGTSNKVAVVISLLYTFIPYHLMRLGHLFLSAYYMIPLISLVILSLWSSQPPFLLKLVNCKSTTKLDFFSRKSLLSGLVCIVLGSTGMYYAFFSCFFIVVSCIYIYLNKKNRQVIVSGAILIALILTTLLINLAPSIIYWMIHGINTKVAQRSPIEAETHGLRIIHLLLPVDGDRLSFLRKITERYDAFSSNLSSRLNESRSASLGIVGSLGFLFLISKLFFHSRRVESEGSFLYYWKILSILNIFAILYATSGGFGSIFALLAFSQLRGLDRISVFIAFFSLLTIAILLDLMQRKFCNTRLKQYIFNLLITLILIVGLLDQVSPKFVPNYLELRTRYLNDKQFVHAIENSIPQGSLVFQLPYVSYPEAPHPNGMNYDHFRPYLHSRDLKWSYGVMRNRHDWQDPLVKREIDADIFLSKIAIAGFNGVYIDRQAYNDAGRKLESELKTRLDGELRDAIVSSDRRFSFYSMTGFRQALLALIDTTQVADYRNKILHPISVRWRRGFYPLEKTSTESWRWAKRKAKIVISNPTNLTRKFQIKMLLATNWSHDSKLKIESVAFSQTLNVNSNPLPFDAAIELPANSQTQIMFRFETEQPLPSGSREQYFQIRNFEVVEDEEIFKGIALDVYKHSHSAS